MPRLMTFEVTVSDDVFADDDQLEQVRNHIFDGTPHAEHIECVNVEMVED